MQLHGRRRVRSGYVGSEHPPEVVDVKPPPPPKVGKGVRWLDHEVQRKRGHSSYLDLESGQSKAVVLQDSDTGKIDGAESLWFDNAYYEDQRREVKAQFFKRLGDDDDEQNSGNNLLDPNWNRLTAYSGHLKKFKPRSYEGEDSEDKSETSASASPTMQRSSATPSPSMGLRGTSASPVNTLTPPMTPSGSFRRSALDTPVGLGHFTVHGLVGEGAFGKVMMATKIDTQKVYAMKVIRKALLFSDATRVSQAITEKQVLQQMANRPHPYVISLRYAFQTEDNIFLVMDLVGVRQTHPPPPQASHFAVASPPAPLPPSRLSVLRSARAHP